MNNWERDAEIARLDLEIKRLWRTLHHFLKESQFTVIAAFTSKETSMNQITPGATIVVTFTPEPSNATLESAPVITSSDPVNAPVTSDPTGLIDTVIIAPSAVIGDGFILSISYTNPDGTVATGSFTGTIVKPVVDVTAFSAAQTS